MSPAPDPLVNHRRRFLAGALLAAILLIGLAELFLRWFPPRDLHPYLGEESPLSGIYVNDPDFGISYENAEAFRTENAAALSPYLPFDGHSRPVWAFFGNSFVQAPGMLADHARSRVTDRLIFNLGRNELLQLRLAQVKILLEQGLRPERIFVELMPADLLLLGPHPLSTTRVTSRGAVTYRPRPNSPLIAWLTTHSRLALTALVRSGGHRGNPRFSSREMYDRIDPTLLADLDHLFRSLARVTREYEVPVTVLLIPAYHQIARGASFNFQDSLTPIFRELDLDVFDPREAYLAVPEKETLFVPDRHFSDRGNEVLLRELLVHLARGKPGTALTDRRKP